MKSLLAVLLFICNFNISQAQNFLIVGDHKIPVNIENGIISLQDSESSSYQLATDIDTIITFDPVTYTESLRIEAHQIGKKSTPVVTAKTTAKKNKYSQNTLPSIQIGETIIKPNSCLVYFIDPAAYLGLGFDNAAYMGEKRTTAYKTFESESISFMMPRENDPKTINYNSIVMSKLDFVFDDKVISINQPIMVDMN